MSHSIICPECKGTWRHCIKCGNRGYIEAIDDSPLPKHVINAFVVNRCYNETALELGPQPRFTVEEERAIKNALLKAYQAGERGDKE